MTPVSSPPMVEQSIDADVFSWGTVRAWPEELAQWRKQPAPMSPEPFSPSLIRNSDDQTIAALWATCEAAAAVDAKADTFGSWGIVAAPKLLGRGGNASSFERFRAEGPWGISPQMIPHQSLHAVSGTISQIFKMRGANFGVGNGPNPSSEGWLAAATLLSDGSLPGLWLLMTGHVGEYLPKPNETAPVERLPCEALALALMPSRGQRSGLHLRIGSDGVAQRGDDFSLSQMIDELTRRDAPPAGKWRLQGAGWVEIEMRYAADSQP